jgi:hypothetical protein
MARENARAWAYEARSEEHHAHNMLAQGRPKLALQAVEASHKAWALAACRMLGAFLPKPTYGEAAAWEEAGRRGLTD